MVDGGALGVLGVLGVLDTGNVLALGNMDRSVGFREIEVGLIMYCSRCRSWVVPVVFLEV